MASSLYKMNVMHHRVRPFRHRFSYRVFSLLLDVDEIPVLGKRLKLFSHNAFNILSFRDRDFGPGDGTPLRAWVEKTLDEWGHDFPVGRIELLCFPRLWGYVFNPLSIYYVHDTDETLRAMLYEVTNTYRDRHSYVLPVEDDQKLVRQACDKHLYVSPFIQMEARYHFRLSRPGQRIGVAIREELPAMDRDSGGNVLFAAMTGDRLPLTDTKLARMVLAHPLMTLKVTAGIHWEAFKLWRKGARVFAHGKPPAEPVTGQRGDDQFVIAKDRSVGIAAE